jgi:hypothetical protein
MDREIGLVKAGHWQCFQMFIVLCELLRIPGIADRRSD